MVSAANRFRLVTFAALVAGPAGGPKTWAEHVTAVRLEPLVGSSGGTITRVLKSDLQDAAGVILIEGTEAKFVAGGTANGTRVEGVLTDERGREVMRSEYDHPNLKHSAHQFADDILFALTQRPGIATSVIAFVSDLSGRKEIYLCASDGSNVRRIPTGAPAVCPSISRDAGFLTYTGYSSGFGDVYFLDLLSARSRRVVMSPGLNSGATVSPDGRRLALTTSRSGTIELGIVGTDGRSMRRMERGRGVPSAPAWSPDGQEVVYSLDEGAGPRLVVASVSGGRRELGTGFTHATEPDWSPDRARLVFTARQNGRDHVALFDLVRGTSRLIAPGQSPAWGADARHVIYSTGESLIVCDVDTGRRREIVSRMGHVSEPTWTK